jgi:hypothetical protein
MLLDRVVGLRNKLLYSTELQGYNDGNVCAFLLWKMRYFFRGFLGMALYEGVSKVSRLSQ